MGNMFIFVAFLYINFSLFQAEPIQNTRRNEQLQEISLPVNEDHASLPVIEPTTYTGQRFNIRPSENQNRLTLPVTEPTTYTGQRFEIRPSKNQNNLINIGSGNNRLNVVDIDDIIRGYTGDIHRDLSNVNRHSYNYNSAHSLRVPGTISNKRFSSFYPSEYESSAPRPFNNLYNRRTMINSVGNGQNNHNTVIIEDGPKEIENTFTDLRFHNNGHTQQTEYLPHSNRNNNAQETPRNHRNYNDQSVFASIGRGPNNKNIVIVNDKVIRSDKGIILTSRPSHGPGQGKVNSCQLADTCHSPNWLSTFTNYMSDIFNNDFFG